jgi:hypothetical protein
MLRSASAAARLGPTPLSAFSGVCISSGIAHDAETWVGEALQRGSG